MSLTSAEPVSWIPRYADLAEANVASLEDIPFLVRAAWEHALLFPELGGEGVEDLIADLKEIVARETGRLTAIACDTTAIKAEAHHIAVQALRSASRITEEGLAGIAAEGIPGGIDPHGWFVYLLWEYKGDAAPLYVGKSTNLFSRLGAHMTDRAKRYRVRWVTLLRCTSERRMNEAEERLIGRYRPELNIAGISGD